MSEKEKKTLICEYCKMSITSPKVCSLCNKVFCAFHEKPDDHKCERVDWKGMEKEREKSEEKKWEHFRELVKQENDEIRWRRIARIIGFVIIIIALLFLAQEAIFKVVPYLVIFIIAFGWLVIDIIWLIRALRGK